MRFFMWLNVINVFSPHIIISVTQTEDNNMLLDACIPIFKDIIWDFHSKLKNAYTRVTALICVYFTVYILFDPI